MIDKMLTLRQKLVYLSAVITFIALMLPVGFIGTATPKVSAQAASCPQGSVNTNNGCKVPRQPGCYISAGGELTRQQNCPSSVTVGNGCWISRAGSGGQSAYERHDCAELTQSGDTTAYLPGCWVETGGDLTSTNCPAGVREDPNACYVASGGSGGVGEFTRNDCEDLVETGVNHEAAVERARLEAECRAETVTADNCAILGRVLTFINALSAAVGVVVVIMIVVGGIQYTTAGGDPQATAAARDRIKNALIALVAYMFMYAFLQWVVPGGVL